MGLDGAHIGTGPSLRSVKSDAEWAAQGGAREPAVCERTDEGCLPGRHVHSRHRPELAFPVTEAGQLAGRADRLAALRAAGELSRAELRAARLAAGEPDRAEVRAWALSVGIRVASAGALPRDVVGAWNREFPGRRFVDGATDPDRRR